LAMEQTGGREAIRDVCSPECDMLNALADAIETLEAEVHAALVGDDGQPGAAWHGGRLYVAVPGGSVVVVEWRDVRA
jgi:hypothetical protein